MDFEYLQHTLFCWGDKNGMRAPDVYYIDVRGISDPSGKILKQEWVEFLKTKVVEMNEASKGPKYPDGFYKDSKVEVGTSPPTFPTSINDAEKLVHYVAWGDPGPSFLANTSTKKDFDLKVIYSAGSLFRPDLDDSQFYPGGLHELAPAIARHVKGEFDWLPNEDSIWEVGNIITAYQITTFQPLGEKVWQVLHHFGAGTYRDNIPETHYENSDAHSRRAFIHPEYGNSKIGPSREY